MMFFRSTVFNFSFFLWTFIIMAVGSPLLLGNSRTVKIVARGWAHGVAWLARVLVGIRWQVEGREHLPHGACIIASQHQSAWETFMMYLIVPRPAYILKKELTYIPLFGWYIARVRAIAVNRKGGASALKDMVRQAVNRLENGRQVVIYPHGTRLRPGQAKPLQPGVAAIYSAAKDFPVVPMTLNSGQCWPKNGWLKTPGTITVRFHPAIPAGQKRDVLMQRLDAVLNHV